MIGLSNSLSYYGFTLKGAGLQVVCLFFPSHVELSMLRERKDGRVPAYPGVHAEHRQTVPGADLLRQ